MMEMTDLMIETVQVALEQEVLHWNSIASYVIGACVFGFTIMLSSFFLDDDESPLQPLQKSDKILITCTFIFLIASFILMVIQHSQVRKLQEFHKDPEYITAQYYNNNIIKGEDKFDLSLYKKETE